MRIAVGGTCREIFIGISTTVVVDSYLVRLLKTSHSCSRKVVAVTVTHCDRVSLNNK
jgi:hypothetical protein